MSIVYTLYLRYCSYFKKASNEKNPIFWSLIRRWKESPNFGITL